MNVLIVHAHPEAKSFCAALKDQARSFFEGRGDQVVLSDLHAMNWNPVADAGDFGARVDPDYLVYALEQRKGVESKTIAPDIQQELEKVLAADLIILNFPIYWFSVPAILKGWIDRVLVSGVCYGGRRFYDRGGLKGKKALVTCTLGGREHMFGENSIHGPLEDMLRPLLRGTLQYVGCDVLKPFVGWHVPYVDDETRQGYLHNYRTYLGEIETAPRLQMVSLDDFDEKMRPLK